jgi:anthranilate/para-aminobenzoate synthase component I
MIRFFLGQTHDSIQVTTHESIQESTHDSIQEHTKEPTKFIFSVRTEDFEIIIKRAFEQIQNGEIYQFKFPSALSSDQRKVIHGKAEECGLFTLCQNFMTSK